MTSTSRSRRPKARRSTSSRERVARSAADKLFPAVEIEGEEFPDYVGMAAWYCREVVAGHVPCCEEEAQACRRFLQMRDQAGTRGADFVWSDLAVADACEFLEKLPYTKGFDGTIVLEPVQCWWVAAIFGFREKDTGRRWVRTVRIWVPRKNGKTELAAGIVLYCANYEGEPSADVVISAASEDQARIPYKAIRKMLEKDDELRQATGADDNKDACTFNDGSIQLAHARAKNLDGLNPHLLLQEELHAQDAAVIGVLKTAQGARRAALDLGISTAGRDVNAPAYDDWKTCKQVLEGRLSAPRLFVAMYAGTDEDKERCFDPAVIEKLNPLYGISLNPTSVDEEVFEARKSETKRQEYLRTRVNIWSRAAGNLISVDAWDKCSNPKLDLDVLKGFPLYVGIDLASRLDLNAAQFLVKAGETLYATSKYWLGEQSERLRDDRFADQFLAWHREKWLTLTKGSFINQKTILREILGMLDGHNVVGVALDDYQADHMSVEIEEAGYEVFIIRKNAKSLTAATEDLVARVGDIGLLEHDGNPVTSWCAGNVVGYWDQNDNVLPKKEKPGSKANIDGIDALIMANALRLRDEAGTLIEDKPAPVNPYLERFKAGRENLLAGG